MTATAAMPNLDGHGKSPPDCADGNVSQILTPDEYSVGRSFRKNFGWSFAGSVIYAGCQWAMLVVLAKFTSPEEVGRFALGLAVTGPIFMFSNLQLRALQVSDARREVRFSDYLTLRIWGTASGLVVALAIALMGRHSHQSVLVIVGLAGAKAVESFSDVLYGLFQQYDRMDRIARSMAARGVLALALMASGVWLGRTAAWGVLGMIIGWSAVLFLGDAPYRAMEETRSADDRTSAQRRRDLWRLGLTGAPLGLVMLLVSLNANIPRYFLQSAWGAHELGIFAALSSLSAAGFLVVNALGQTASTRLARFAAAGERASFVRLMVRLLLFGSALGCAGVVGAICVGRWFVEILFRPEYAREISALVMIMIAAGLGFVASIVGFAMTALRIFRSQVPLVIATCAATALWAWFDVGRAGVDGAARALIAGSLVQLGGAAIIVKGSLRLASWK